MRPVYTADDPIRAYIVKNFLEAVGTPAVVVGELLFPLRGKISLSEDTLPQVWVTNDDDVVRARQLIEERDVPTRHPAPFWVRCIVLFLLLSWLSCLLPNLTHLLPWAFR